MIGFVSGNNPKTITWKQLAKAATAPAHTGSSITTLWNISKKGIPNALPLSFLNLVLNLSLYQGYQIDGTESQNLAARESRNVGFSSLASAARKAQLERLESHEPH